MSLSPGPAQARGSGSAQRRWLTGIPSQPCRRRLQPEGLARAAPAAAAQAAARAGSKLSLGPRRVFDTEMDVSRSGVSGSSELAPLRIRFDRHCYLI